jgi:hypothetical protein
VEKGECVNGRTRDEDEANTSFFGFIGFLFLGLQDVQRLTLFQRRTWFSSAVAQGKETESSMFATVERYQSSSMRERDISSSL